MRVYNEMASQVLSSFLAAAFPCIGSRTATAISRGGKLHLYSTNHLLLVGNSGPWVMPEQCDMQIVETLSVSSWQLTWYSFTTYQLLAPYITVMCGFYVAELVLMPDE
jgi:hypothetical protein